MECYLEVWPDLVLPLPHLTADRLRELPAGPSSTRMMVLPPKLPTLTELCRPQGKAGWLRKALVAPGNIPRHSVCNHGWSRNKLLSWSTSMGTENRSPQGRPNLNHPC